MSMFHAMRSLIRGHLENPFKLRWTVQGFGMMRCYFEDYKRFRLNIWDAALAVPGVSTIHDHPWHFTSWVVNGWFHNIRFAALKEGYGLLDDREMFERGWRRYTYTTIKTGEGGGKRGKIDMMWLQAQRVENYGSGSEYRQAADEVHMSTYNNGTVTLNDRTRIGDGAHAKVFWPNGEKWVDAKPREDTGIEISRTCNLALENWL